MVIERTDRIAAVLGSDEQLLDVFVAASPIFERLRNPVLRRTMGRLTSVEQAARIAGIDPDLLTERLNRARKRGTTSLEEPRPTPPAEAATPVIPRVPAAAPPELAAISGEKIVELDVREELRAGREPFSLIMAARREVPEGGALRLRAIFEPVPLYAVLGRQGFQHWSIEHAPDDWEVWFFPLPAAAPAIVAVSDEGPSRPPEQGGGDVVVLDVRGMDPPEPMVRTLAALEALPSGHTLLQINERVPRFLLPRLKDQGFTWEIREQERDLVRIFIRRAD